MNLLEFLEGQLNKVEEDLSVGFIEPNEHRRGLAFLESQRRLIDHVFRLAARVDNEWGCSHDPADIRANQCGLQPIDSIQGLRLMALAFSVDHPDYKPEWAPHLHDLTDKYGYLDERV